MKHLRKFNENISVNEELTGLGLLACLGAAIIAPGLYRKAKQFWSKHVISEKYKPTGKKEIVICELPENISSYAIISRQERDSGQVKTELTQYQDDYGNLYWGYDHLWSDQEYGEWSEYVQSCNLYTAIFKESDFNELKAFLINSDRFKSEPIKWGSAKIESKIKRPKPVEMIFRKDLETTEFGNY